ncbi:hypothetical protein CR51_30920 [Caballeronia megalochromosomata]|nr:hypothetical protein CR51_30920 [Caballeronia megalochromosomata]
MRISMSLTDSSRNFKSDALNSGLLIFGQIGKLFNGSLMTDPEAVFVVRSLTLTHSWSGIFLNSFDI